MKNVSASFQYYPSGCFTRNDIISISGDQNEFCSNTIYVIVEKKEELGKRAEIPPLRIKYDYLPAHKDIQFFGDFIVIGFGNYIYFFNLKRKECFHYPLNVCFKAMHIAQNRLYVCSFSDIICFNIRGKIKWVSAPLGNDGVYISRATPRTIAGFVKCNPPDEWQEFIISAKDGEPCSSFRYSLKEMRSIGFALTLKAVLGIRSMARPFISQEKPTAILRDRILIEESEEMI